MTGIEGWRNAFIDSETKQELQQAFDLSDDQIQLILNWLWNGSSSFSRHLLPQLLESELGYNMTITEFANVLFLEQWANGTIMGMVMFPEGIDFHDFIPSLPSGTIGFEVGIPIPTNMSLSSALLLWDPSNPYSLVQDIQIWWDIGSKHSLRYNMTRDINYLDDTTMDMILKWLHGFKKNLMPSLAEYEMNLPMDAKSLGNTIQLGMVIFGGITLGITSTALTRTTILRLKKRKLDKVSSKKPLNKIHKSKYSDSKSTEGEFIQKLEDDPKSRESNLLENIEEETIQQEATNNENKQVESKVNNES